MGIYSSGISFTFSFHFRFHTCAITPISPASFVAKCIEVEPSIVYGSESFTRMRRRCNTLLRAVCDRYPSASWVRPKSIEYRNCYKMVIKLFKTKNCIIFKLLTAGCVLVLLSVAVSRKKMFKKNENRGKRNKKLLISHNKHNNKRYIQHMRICWRSCVCVERLNSKHCNFYSVQL